MSPSISHQLLIILSVLSFILRIHSQQPPGTVLWGTDGDTDKDLTTTPIFESGSSGVDNLVADEASSTTPNSTLITDTTLSAAATIVSVSELTISKAATSSVQTTIIGDHTTSSVLLDSETVQATTTTTSGLIFMTCKLPACVNGRPELINGTECTCVCETAWSGKNCDVEDICVTDNPCHHSGECYLRPDGGYYCDCKLGYMTPNCMDRDPCALKEDHCLNGATCHRLDDIDFTCACQVPYEGDHCETKNLCNLDIGECLDTGTDLDITDPQCYPCSTNIVPGGCIFHPDSREYECVCLPSFEPDTCDTRSKGALFNTTMTLPVLNLHEMLPHNFIVHRLNITQNTTILLAINVTTPSNFTIHVSAKQKYRPVCSDILKFWYQAIPTDENNIYLVLTENLDRPFDDDDTYYVQFWPQSNIIGSRRPVEVTFDYGFYEMDCVRKDDMTPESSGNFTIIYKSDCFIRVAEMDKKMLLCDCVSEPFEMIFEYLTLLEYNVEVFMPVDLFTDYEECRIIPWVVLSCSLLYVFILFILICSDCRNRKRPNLVVMTHIELIEEETFYLLTIKTGNAPLASSSANICCEVYGSCRRTKPLILKDNKLLHTTRQDDEDNFLFSTEKDLGDLTKIRIWHDNSGDWPDWYCRKVIIKNIKSGRSWYFFVRQWMSVTDSTMICSQDAATPKELIHHHRGKFSTVFRHQFRDSHIVLCPFLCPPRSLYLRCERWTVLMTVIFIYFILLIFFYGMPLEIQPGIVMEYSAHNIVHDFVIFNGLSAALIGLPLAIFLDAMFRLIRQKRRIPTLLVCSKNNEVPERPPPPQDLAYSRWNNLDPNRIMVEAIRMDDYLAQLIPVPQTTPPSPPPELSNPVSESESFDSLRFQIPSTSVSRTETWIGQLLQEEPAASVQKLSLPPNKPAYKKVLNDGVVGAVTSMKDDGGPTRLVYKPEGYHHVDDAIATDIRRSFDDPLWYMTPSRRPSPKASKEILLGLGGRDSIEKEDEKIIIRVPDTRDAGVQTNFAYLDASTSKKLSDEDDVDNEKMTRRRPHVELCEVAYTGNRLRCPKTFLYFLWALCILIMITCATMTIIYGLRYGYVRSVNWCFSLLWAVLFAFVGLELIKLLIYSVYILFCKLRRKNAEYYDEKKAKERFQLMLFVGSCNFPPKWPLHYILFFPTTIYEPLSSYRMFYLRMEENKRTRIRKSLLDMAIFMVFTLCVILVSILVRDVDHFHSGNNIKDIFEIHVDEMYQENSFWSIHSPDDFYNYMAQKFLPQFTYISEMMMEMENLRKPHFHQVMYDEWFWLSNNVSLVIGSIRLRQQRVMEGACLAQDNYLNLFSWPIKCVGDFKDTVFISTKDTDDYTLGWKPLHHRNGTFSNKNDERDDEYQEDKEEEGEEEKKIQVPTKFLPQSLSTSGWKYMTHDETDSLYYRGYQSWYDGGGYVIDLPFNKTSVHSLLDELKTNNWVDHRTRIILIEFTTYNPPVELYSVIVFALERTSFNSWNHSSRTMTNKFSWAGQQGIPPSTITLIFVMCCCLFYLCGDAMVHFHRSFVEQGVKGWKYMWLWIDFFIAISGICMIAVFFVAWENGRERVGLIDGSTDKFINFQKAAKLRLDFVHIVCFVLVLCYVKMWRLMIFSNRSWYIIGFTLSLTRRLGLGFVIYFIILLFAFGSFCHLVFGLYDHQFMSFTVAVTNLVQVAKVSSAMSFKALKRHQFILGPIFYLLYNVIAYFIYMNVIISVLTAGLQDARDSAYRRSFHHTYLKLIWSKIKEFNPRRFYNRLDHKKDNDDEDEECNVVHQPVQHLVRDAGDIQLHRWQQMKSIAHKYIKKRINSPIQVTLRNMKKVAQQVIDPRVQVIVSKNEKLRQFRILHMKIKEERLLGMKSIIREFLKKKTGHDLTAMDMKAYDDYNLNLIKLKHQKLEKQVDRLNRLLGDDGDDDEHDHHSRNNNNNYYY